MPFVSRINKTNVVAEYESRAARELAHSRDPNPEEIRENVIADILWCTMGPANARIRQELMQMFSGTKLPQAKCGVDALIEAAKKTILFPVPGGVPSSAESPELINH